FQTYPAVAMGANGDFVVAWMSDYQGRSGSGVYARRYSAGGDERGEEFRVNTTTALFALYQRYPAVAMNSVGEFVVAWNRFVPGIRPGSNSSDIYGQRFDADGAAQGDEFKVNTV